jgi:hypothetical protein
MKLFNTLFFLFAFFPIHLSAQPPSGIIVRSDLFKNFFAKNPNVSIEKIFSERISGGLEGAWIRRDRAWTGSEPAGVPFAFSAPAHKSNGLTLGVFTRYYFGTKHQVPDAAFISGFLQYNSTTIKGLEIQQGIDGLYKRTIDLHRSGPELGCITGRQFLVAKKISLEINVGISNYFTYAKETFIAGERGVEYVNGIYKYRENHTRGHLNFSIGYLFRKRMEE